MRRVALPFVMMLSLAGCHKQAAEAPQATAPEAPAASPAKEMGEVSREKAGKYAPDVKIDDLASGQPTTIAAFKGKPVLVNLWATWCGPCVRELPSLDALAKAKGDGLVVLAVSQDMQGQAVVPPYLKKAGIALHPYHDRDMALPRETGEQGLPVSIFYGADGREKWRVRGPMDWTGAAAKALLAEGA